MIDFAVVSLKPGEEIDEYGEQRQEPRLVVRYLAVADVHVQAAHGPGELEVDGGGPGDERGAVGRCDARKTYEPLPAPCCRSRE